MLILSFNGEAFSSKLTSTGGRRGRGRGKRGGGGSSGSGNVRQGDTRAKFVRKICIIKEEPIALDEIVDTPIPTRVEEMGWERLVTTPRRINLCVVYEFYCKIDSETFMEQGVMVRGVRVPFNPEVVNNYFETPNFPNHYQGFPDENDYKGDISASVAEEL